MMIIDQSWILMVEYGYALNGLMVVDRLNLVEPASDVIIFAIHDRQ